MEGEFEKFDPQDKINDINANRDRLLLPNERFMKKPTRDNKSLLKKEGNTLYSNKYKRFMSDQELEDEFNIRLFISMCLEKKQVEAIILELKVLIEKQPQLRLKDDIKEEIDRLINETQQEIDTTLRKNPHSEITPSMRKETLMELKKACIKAKIYGEPKKRK